MGVDKLHVGQILPDIEIDNYSYDGRGVGRYRGYTLFIPGAIPGERVRVQLKRKGARYGEADLLDVIDASPFRNEPRCPVFGDCGGCQLQHLHYSAQLDFKEERVRQVLQRLGEVSTVPPVAVYGAEKEWCYRNKATYHLERSNGLFKVGFFSRQTHRVIPHRRCFLQPHTTDTLRITLEEAWQRSYLQGGRGLSIRTSLEAEKQIVILNGDVHLLKPVEQLEKFLSAEAPLLVGGFRQRRPGKLEHIWGERSLPEQMGGFCYNLSPVTFFQVNPWAREKLLQRVQEHLALQPDDLLFDLYAGVGALSFPLAQQVKRVIALEAAGAAVEDAKRHAQAWGITNIEFFTGRVERMTGLLLKLKPNVVLLDPPREGCDLLVLNSLVDCGAGRVVYVSCNPATLARDLKLLQTGGFLVDTVDIVDMFPQTYHVECVVLMSRIEK